MMAGGLGEDALGGASIGLVYFNLMFYFLLGVVSALETLGSQAYGAGDVDGVISWWADEPLWPANRLPVGVA